MNSSEKPLWKSKKHIVFLLTALLLVGMQAAGAPTEVTSKLADAIWWGLPILLAGQSWIDAKAKTPANQS